MDGVQNNQDHNKVDGVKIKQIIQHQEDGAMTHLIILHREDGEMTNNLK